MTTRIKNSNIKLDNRAYSISKVLKITLNKKNLTIQKNINYKKNMGIQHKFNKEKNIINDTYYIQKNGFKNLGATCYMNSFLQILIHIPGFIEKLKKDKNIWKGNNIFYYLINVADNPSKENLEKIKQLFNSPHPNYKYYYQEDSQEFGAELLKILNIEYSDLEDSSTRWELNGFNFKNKSNNYEIKQEKLNKLLEDDDCEFKYDNFILQFFHFYESDSFFCNNKLIHVNYYGDVDNQLSFNLNNQESKIELIDLLRYKYSKNLKLIKLPNIFMITLLRAIINQPLIKQKVKFEKELNIKEFLDNDFGDYEKSTKYILYALNVCIGNYKRYGHYYSYILINEEWFKFDDYKVNKVDEKEIEKDLQYIYGIFYINEEYLNSFKKKN